MTLYLIGALSYVMVFVLILLFLAYNYDLVCPNFKFLSHNFVLVCHNFDFLSHNYDSIAIS